MLKKSLPDFGGNLEVKHNFFMNLLDGGIFSFAMSLVSQITVLPVLIIKMGGTNLALGLVPVLWTVGFNFPQIFIANYARTLPFKKKFILKTGLAQRLPWLLLAILTYFEIGKISNNIGLFLILTFFTLSAIGGSSNLPGWFDLISKITPVNLRGRLFAYRSILGGILGILGGAIVTIVLNSIKYPFSFALLFLAAFLITMISYIFVAKIKESQPNQPEQLFLQKEFFGRLLKIFKTDHGYRNFVIADSLMNITLMADAFYTVNAIEKLSLSDSFAGIFTMIMMISMIGGNLFFGYIADKFGHRLNLMMSAIIKFIVCIIAFITPPLGFYLLVFVGAALTTSLITISRLTMIAEICNEDDRPTYVAFTNMLTAPFVLLGIAGGWLANHFGYHIVFIISGFFSFIAAIWYLIMVDEPRNKRIEINVSGFKL
ncbi:MAG: MFS transporter [Ignavibacteriaceae bacterium]